MMAANLSAYLLLQNFPAATAMGEINESLSWCDLPATSFLACITPRWRLIKNMAYPNFSASSSMNFPRSKWPLITAVLQLKCLSFSVAFSNHFLLDSFLAQQWHLAIAPMSEFVPSQNFHFSMFSVRNSPKNAAAAIHRHTQNRCQWFQHGKSTEKTATRRGNISNNCNIGNISNMAKHKQASCGKWHF